MTCARRGGLISLPEALGPLPEDLGPAYRRNAIVSQSEHLLALINVQQPCEAARALLEAV